jgi:hypothetical protein
MATAFQANAFQNNAFQITGTTKKKVGWMPEWGSGRFRHDPEELERRIAAQRGFGPQRYGELLEEAATKAREAENKAERKAIKKAITSAELVATEELPPILLVAAEDLVRAKRVKESLEAARHMEALARAYYEYEMEQDEEEALMLLLN